MHFLNVEEIIAIHVEAIQDFGGSLELLSLERLKSCLESPQQAMFGKDLYPDLASKAAILFFLLIKNHPFLDGNKRTGVLALFEFLERNGSTLEVDKQEFFDFTIDVSTSKFDKDQIAVWIQAHMREK